MCSAPTTVSATRREVLLTPFPWESSERSSAGDLAATARVAPHASVTARLRLERLCRRAHHLGQARPGLDRLGDRVERREIGHRR